MYSSRYKPVELKAELTDRQVARFAVNQFRFTGVSVSTYQDREYPYGADLAHVVGYVSKINDADYRRLVKMIPIAPTRGLIYDRNGIPLVHNVTWYDVLVTPYKVSDMAATLRALTPLLDLTPDDIEAFRHALQLSLAR
ncbi:hypothetical protein CRX72_04105 [Pantoea sp. BRM17]|nr:hypothetical protein CRX72_04105 [Pantoea sp. BRM17]